MNKEEIAPSLLSADLARLGEDLSAVIAAGADMIHLDVMDNHYVPNLTFGPVLCEALKAYGITVPIDVHLMVRPVDDLIRRFADAGADLISFHPEASDHVDRSLQLIRDRGCRSGLALNPATPISVLDYVWDKLDFVLVMSVNPGFGGQAFIPSAIDKIVRLAEIIKQQKHPIRLSVDGGVGLNNLAAVAKAGANRFVMGSAIFKEKNYPQTIQKMRQVLEDQRCGR